MRSRTLQTAVALAVCAALVSVAARSDDETRARMYAVFSALSTALNLTLYDTPFETPKRDDMVLEALSVLSDNADALETHGALDPSYDFARRSLARDAREAVIRYRQRRYEGARFMMEQLVSNCVSCHSRLPPEHDFVAGREFADRARIDELPLDQRARLLVATRQFDLALDAYEQCFTSRDVPASEIIANGAMASYLELCLRVRRDYDRALSTLRAFRRRDDVQRFLASRVDEWITTIRGAQSRRLPADDANLRLADARRLVREARQHNVFPDDRYGLAHFVIASGLLYEHLSLRPEPVEDRCEALYLLGVCESYTSPSYWESETAFFLEAAIRMAPETTHARLAYDFLEAYISLEYTGSGGVALPAETRDRLDELRALLPGRP